MSTTYQTPAQPMPLLTTLALRITMVTCLLLVAALPVMRVQFDLGALLVMVAFLGWFIASWCGLFGVARAKPKTKAINVFLFSLVGPLLTYLLILLLGTLPRLFS
jgi:hypothetical protein